MKKLFLVLFLLASAATSLLAANTLAIQYIDGNGTVITNPVITRGQASTVKVRLKITNLAGISIEKYVFTGVDGLYIQNQIASNPNYSILTSESTPNKLTIQVVANSATSLNIDMDVWAGQCFPFSVTEFNDKTQSDPFKMVQTSNNATAYLPSISIRKGAFLNYLDLESTRQVLPNNEKIATFSYVLVNNSSVSFDGNISFKESQVGSAYDIRQVNFYKCDKDGVNCVLIKEVDNTEDNLKIGDNNNDFLIKDPIDVSVSLAIDEKIKIEEVVQVNGCLLSTGATVNNSAPTIKWGNAAYDLCASVSTTTFIQYREFKPNIRCADVVGPNHFCFGDARVVGDRGVMREYKISNLPSTTFTTDVAKNVMIRLDGNADYLSPFNIPYVPNVDNDNENIFITVNGDKYVIDMDTYTIDYNALYSKTTTNPSFLTNDQLQDWQQTGYVLFRERRATAKINGIFSLEDYITKVQISPVLPTDYLYSADCIGGFDSKVIKGLAIDRYKRAGIDHINDPFIPIDIKPNDVVILHWREVNCCFDDQKMTQFNGIYSSNVSVSYETLCKTEKIASVTPSVSRAAFTFIPNPSNPVTEGDADRCRSTSDGLVERISAKIEGSQLVTPGGYVSRQGRVVFRVYVQNGLDLDKALKVPRASGWIAQAGYNNVTDNQLYVQNALSGCVGSTCAGNAAGDPCNLGNIIQNPDYYVRLRPTKLGTQLNISPRSIRLVTSDTQVQETGQTPASMTGPLKQELYFSNDGLYANQLYEIEFTVDDLLTFFAANRGSIQNSTPQNNLFNLLNQSVLDLDLRAYCSINGKPSYQVIMYMDRCDGVSGPLSNTTCAPGYTTMEPITTFENSVIVNCPGCLIPGANIESSALVRSVNSRGLVDADGDRRPDVPNTTLPAAHPTLKIAAMGDEMTATFTCYMSDGEDGVKGISKGTLDAEAVNNPNFNLDNFMVLGQFDGAITKDYVENPAAIIPKIIPKNIEIKSVRMTYKGMERIYSVGNGLVDHLFYPGNNSFLVRAKIKDFFDDPTDVNIPKSFGTGARDGINFELTYVIGDLGYDVKPVEVSYTPHYTPCDNCNDFTNMNLVNPADNSTVNFTNLATVATYNDKTLWKCSGFSNRFKYIPYKQISSYGASDATCNKSVSVTMSGIFDAKRDVDYFQEEFRMFLHSDLKTEILIPLGYKPVSINITNKFLYNNREYTEAFIITDEDKIKTVHVPNTNSANNALYPTLCAMSAQFEQMNNPIRVIAPLAQGSTFNNIFPDGIVQNISRGDETFLVEFKVNFVKDASVQCSAIPEYKFWNATNDVWSNIPMLYPNQSNMPSFVAVDNNVNPQFRTFQANPHADLRPTASIDVSSNGGQVVLTKPIANLQIRNLGLLTLPPITTNQIQIPIEIANNKFNTYQIGQADFPYLQIYGDALTKGLTLVGVYRIDNTVTTPVFYPEIIRGNLTTDGIMVGIDYQSAGKRAPSRIPYLLPGIYQYVLVFENSCPANCNQNVGCGTTNELPNTCLVGIKNLHIGYGWNCNGYPTFDDLHNKSTCGQYDPLVPDPIDPVITPTFKPLDYTVTVASVGLTVNTSINGTPVGNNDAMEIAPCDVENIYTITLSSCKETGFNEYQIEFSGLSSGITIMPKDRPTGDQIHVERDVNPAKPNLFHITTTTSSLLKGEARIDFIITTTSCNIPNQTLTTIVSSKTFCTPTAQINFSINNPLQIKRNPATMIADNIALSTTGVTVYSQNQLAVQYTVAGAGAGVTKFNNTILVQVRDGATSLYSEVIPIPAGTTNGIVTSLISPGITSCNTYVVDVTTKRGYVPSCGVDGAGAIIPACINTLNDPIVSKSVVFGSGLNPSITTSTGYASFLCGTGGSVTLVASPSGLSYRWRNPEGLVLLSTTETVVVNEIGVYTVEVTNACGTYTASASVVNRMDVNCPAPICPGELPNIQVNNFGGVVGTYTAQWYDPNVTDSNDPADLQADILMDKGIFVSGYYYAAAVTPTCTLRTNAIVPQKCPIEVLRAPQAFHITSDKPSGDASILFLCDGNTAVFSVTNKTINDAFATDVVWTSGQTTTDDIIVPHGAYEDYYITATDVETSCTTVSNQITIIRPYVHIRRVCVDGGQIKLTAVSNFDVTPDKYNWYLDGTPLADGVDNVDALQAGVYTVDETATGCSLNNRCWGIQENLITTVQSDEQLSIQDGGFEGITATQSGLGFETDFEPLDRTGYIGSLPLDYTIGKFMINGANLEASNWSPNTPSSWIHSNTNHSGTGSLLIDGDSKANAQLIWGKTVPVTHGANYLCRFMVRNIDLLTQYPVQEIPELSLHITYLDGNGRVASQQSVKQAIFNNGQTPWIEFSSYTQALPLYIYNCTDPSEIQTVRLELFMKGGGSIGRDLSIDDFSLIPVGICQSTTDLNLPCNTALAEIENNYLVVCPGSTAQFNIVNAPAGLTYVWQKTTAGVITNQANGNAATFNTPALNLIDPLKPLIATYQVIITDPINNCQTRLASTAVVSPRPTLSISTEWTGSNCERAFVAAYDGLGSPSQYEWYLNGSLVNETTANYVVANLQENDFVQSKLATAWCAEALPLESNNITIENIVVTANAGWDKQVCFTESVQIGAPAITGATYSWMPILDLDDAHIAAPLVAPRGTQTSALYTLSATDVATGCVSTDEVVVTINPLPIILVTNPAAVCAPSTVDLTLPSITSGSTTGLVFTYFTDVATTNALLNPTDVSVSGTYYIKGTTADGCVKIEPVVVTINSLPVIVVTNPAAVCAPSTVDITLPSVTLGSTTDLVFTYFSDAATTYALLNPATVAVSETYYIKATTAAGCVKIEPVEVTINPLPTITAHASSVCTPATVDITLPSVTSGSTTGLVFTYFSDVTTTNALLNPTAVSVSEIYYIKGTTAAGCISTAPVDVTINPLPMLLVTNPTALCVPGTVDITLPSVTFGSTTGLAFTYFSDEATTNGLLNPASVSVSEIYYIKGVTIDGCLKVVPVVVTINALPSLVITNPLATVSPNVVDIALPSVTAGSTLGLMYTYFNDMTTTSELLNPNAIDVSGTYYIKGTVQSTGCYAIEPVEVVISTGLRVDMSSGMGSLKVDLSPNPFSKNTIITVSGATYNYVKVTLLDMNGKIVFENANVPNNDSTPIGEDLPSAMYIVQVIDGEKTKTIKIVKIE